MYNWFFDANNSKHLHLKTKSFYEKLCICSKMVNRKREREREKFQFLNSVFQTPLKI